MDSRKNLTEVGEMDGVEIHANILATIARVLIEKE
jgi:CHASE2 domain-containing sensor protein